MTALTSTGRLSARPVAQAATAAELAMFSRPRQAEGPFISPRQGRSGRGTTGQRQGLTGRALPGLLSCPVAAPDTSAAVRA